MDQLHDQSNEFFVGGVRSRNYYMVIAVISFFLGVIVSFVATDSLFGFAPGSIIDGRFNTKFGSASQSERLIAEGSVIAVARSLRPSVTNIQTQQNSSTGLSRHSADGVGSGIIIRSDGYIVTNEHVVGNAKKISANVGGEKLPAILIGTDKDTDIAVIKVDRTGLPVPRFGNVRNLKVGELAVAIGSPFGFQRSVTAGVVSALDRNVTVGDELDKPRTYSHLIQTDASINPGNSGGALSNKAGEVVGMNSLIYSTTGVSQGIGFAIPIDLAKRIASQLIEKGAADHPYLGLLGQSVTQDMSDRQQLLVNDGVIVNKITAGSPVARAGLKPGDIITSLNKQRVSGMDDLVGEVRARAIGETITLEILRSGSKRQISVVLVVESGDGK